MSRQYPSELPTYKLCIDKHATQHTRGNETSFSGREEHDSDCHGHEHHDPPQVHHVDRPDIPRKPEIDKQLE
jgi:hypothetical protein